MTIIKLLSGMIEEEIHDSERYANLALTHKEDMPKLAELFHRLSRDEMSHADLLHDAVVEIIKDYRNQHGDPPSGMLAVYEYLHEKQIAETAKVKTLQNMFTE